MNLSIINTLQFIIQHPLNKKRKTRAILDFLKWQFGSRLVPGAVIYPWIENTKFIISPGEHGLTQNVYCGLQEFNDMAYVLHVLRKDDLFIDIGANVGSYTILASGVKEARTHSFEPVPQTFFRLIDNLKLNDLLNRVQAHNMGLADKEGELFFTSNENTGNHILTEDDKHVDAVKVKVIPLDAIIEDEMPSLIKIDVEGFETLVIAGALKTLQKSSLHSVIMEINGNGLKCGFSEEKLLDTMRSFGFHPYTYDPFTRHLIALTAENTLSNTIFCRDESLIHSRLASADKFCVNGIEL